MRMPYIVTVIDRIFGGFDPDDLDLPSHDAPHSSTDYSAQFRSAAVRTTLSR